mmetsp:Transcript_2803/g.10401  ORF Transcript_2803/g.10401 Transcript_2803/m.10401 type:complete len:204 (-) Transcript_2803:987-1598(-)
MALGTGAFSSHADRDHASNSAELAPIPLNGDIGCAASPMATTLDLASFPVGGLGGRSRSYSGPAHESSQSVASNIAGTGSCQVATTDWTNSFAPPGPPRGADAIDRASSSVTRTEICHIVRGPGRRVPPADSFAGDSSFAASFGDEADLRRRSSVSSDRPAGRSSVSSDRHTLIRSHPAPRPRASSSDLNGMVNILARSPSRV